MLIRNRVAARFSFLRKSYFLGYFLLNFFCRHLLHARVNVLQRLVYIKVHQAQKLLFLEFLAPSRGQLFPYLDGAAPGPGHSPTLLVRDGRLTISSDRPHHLALVVVVVDAQLQILILLLCQVEPVTSLQVLHDSLDFYLALHGRERCIQATLLLIKVLGVNLAPAQVVALVLEGVKPLRQISAVER